MIRVAISLAVACALVGSARADRGADLVEGFRSGALPPEGYWAELAPPTRFDHAAVFDPVRRRLIVVAGSDGSFRGDVWALALAGAPVWTRLEVAGPGPPGRSDHTAIYDPVGDRVLVYGGESVVAYDRVYLDDVWELSLSGSPTWSLLEPAGERPVPRAHHTSIFDSARRRMVVFGGFRITPAGPGEEFQDTWAFELEGTPRWTKLVTVGAPVRSSHVAVYDPVGDRMVIHGGFGGQPIASDSWSLAFATGEWQELSPAGAAPNRAGHAAVFDPVRGRLVLFGGGFKGDDDVWALSLADPLAWTLIPTGDRRPTPRSGHAMAYDAIEDRIVVSGGWDGQARGDVWALTLSGAPTWNPLRVQEPGPTEREGAAAVHDPVRRQILLFGGRQGSEFLGDLWELPLVGRSEWRRVLTAVAPPGRQGASLTYDPARDRFLLYGGIHWGPGHDDLWELRLTPRPTWTRLEPEGPTPGGTSTTAAIHDPDGDRMIVYGGVYGLPDSDKLWALALQGPPRWSEIVPEGPPPPAREEHTAIYDPVGHRMLVFGGPYFNYVWELTLAGTPRWSMVGTIGSPPHARRGHTALYDAARHRMLVFGGRSSEGITVLDNNDLWELSLDGPPTWRLLAPEGPRPVGRTLHAAALDPRGNRMIVFGGESTGPPFAFPGTTWQVVLGPAAPVIAEATVAWNRVRLAWQSFGGAGEAISIHRRTAIGPTVVATGIADGEGLVGFEDADVLSGRRYEYWAEQNGMKSETLHLDVPLARLSLAGARPSPVIDRLVIAFALENDSPAQIEVFDLQGRKVLAVEVPGPRPGDGTMDLGDARDLAAGVYLARVRQNGRSASGKLTITH